MVGIVQLRKSFSISAALVFVGTTLALLLSFGLSSQRQTLFTDDFKDGNADGRPTSCGRRAVASDGSFVYKQSGIDTSANSYTNADTHSNSNSDANSSASRRPARWICVIEWRRDGRP